ncbi:peptide chain release factor 1 [Dialister pneumosintes]|uniref:Peptide chain release factor 1 n=1 Tax=Dialister pneumosintes TaxID=39950 RepID=A0A1B3WDJ3_9FIRM|nr:peptide chain release factor 1 [Dialister pneumosintes]AOH39050.1 peptide chain release factor 1 [Dialister pneumosintes]MBS6479784.1 peptide chain release factor 1 [Dialister sp.]RID93978.1 peptide chain release factor 1 [Dialister pneumosintes]
MKTEKLEAKEARFLSIEDQLSDPSVIANQTKWRALSKEHAELSEIVQKFREYKEANKRCQDLKDILGDNDMKELHDLAKEELKEATEEIVCLEKEIRVLLIPKDPNDNRNVILEIRAGTGGDEAALFAADLIKMYLKFAESRGWKTSIADSSETDLGGFKEVTCLIDGQNAYSLLKFESGVHRVQRVPETESSGRVHTSAVTVAVLPEAQDVDVDIDMKDLRIDVYRASGAGGQHINKTSSAIRITHIPTGTVVTCQNERDQRQNKEKALQILRSRLYLEALQKEVEKTAADRKGQVGSGDRSERIRTYNFPQGRVTDHRVHVTLYQLDDFLNGHMEPILHRLIEADLAQRMGNEDE